MNKFKFLPASLFFLFICYVIFMADTDQQNWLMQLPKSFAYGDKVGHFSLFGTLALLLNYATDFRYWKHRQLFIGSMIVLAFALLEEFTQLAFSSRTFDLVDMLFDILGIVSLTNGTIKMKIITARIQNL